MTARSLKFLAGIAVTLLSCNNVPFTTAGWTERIDLGSYPQREAMLDDLLDHHVLDGISHDRAVALLGPPDGYDRNEMWYEVNVEYDMIDPESGTNLVLFLAPDSSVTGHYVQNWHR